MATPKATRAVITEEMVRTAYDVGKSYKSGEVERKDGIEKLTRLGMNQNSATDYLYFYSKLMANKEFTRTANAFATNYFLDRILLEGGKAGLKIALNSLGKHLDYYEAKANVKIKSRRNIHAKFLAKLN